MVLQMEAAECGAASLGIILAYHHKFVPIEELRMECGVSRDGSKASYIVKAANKYGLKHTAIRRKYEDVLLLKPPFIIFWKSNHFLVFEGATPNFVYLNDPASGRRKVSHQEFESSFSGIVLSFVPTDTFMPGGKTFNGMQSLQKWLSVGRREFAWLFLLGFLAIIPAMVLPTFSKVFVDQVLINNMSSWIAPLLLAIVVAVGIKTLLEQVSSSILEKLDIKLSTLFSHQFFSKSLSLSPSFYLNRSASEIASRISYIKDISSFATGEMAKIILGTIGVFFYVLVLFWYDVELTFLSILLALCNFFILFQFAKRRKEISQLMAQDEGNLMANLINGFSMLETIKAGGRETEFYQKIIGLDAKIINSAQHNAKMGSYLNVLPFFLFSLNMLAIVYIGGLKVIDGEMTMGMLLAYIIFIGYFYDPILSLVRVSTKVQELQGKLVRIDELLEKSVAETPENNSYVSPGEASLTIENLTFGYNKMAPPLFNALSFSIKHGEKVAFVGPSGSGKSTLVKIITGIYEPWSGEILYGNYPLQSIPPDNLSKELAVVDQHIFLFEGKLKDVLTLWDPEIEQTTLVEACKDACIHNEITKRNKGYYTQVSEGGKNFSGGQMQRLEIARALARKPRLLILDESTSALDPHTEMEIYRNISRRGCTTISIAHRLSTIRDCDRIFVMDAGKIVEEGNHDDLITLDGLYATLVKTDG